MKNFLIITAHVEGLNYIDICQNQYDCVICADGGLEIAGSLGLTPDLLIGDYDSGQLPENREVIRLPMEKDMTDSEAALDLAVSEGGENIIILGGLGGRFDHTMGNIGLLAKYCGRLHELAFVDGYNRVSMLEPGCYDIPKNNYRYMGLIAYGGSVKDLTLRGVKYPLTKYPLRDDTSLGVSNEITASAASLRFSAGRLLLVFSDDTPQSGTISPAPLWSRSL